MFANVSLACAVEAGVCNDNPIVSASVRPALLIYCIVTCIPCISVGSIVYVNALPARTYALNAPTGASENTPSPKV